MCNVCQTAKVEARPYATREDAADALEALLDETDEQCRDNYRFAYQDDADAMAAYDKACDDGCCGSVDLEIAVAGRAAWIGCNYGH